MGRVPVRRAVGAAPSPVVAGLRHGRCTLLALAAAEEYLSLDPFRVLCFDAALALIVGFEANDMRRRALEARGYIDGGLAAGSDLAEAELRWRSAHAT